MNDNKRSWLGPLTIGAAEPIHIQPRPARLDARNGDLGLSFSARPVALYGDVEKAENHHSDADRHNDLVHRLPPRSTDAIQPIRLGRREIERVHVLMGILDRRAKK